MRNISQGIAIGARKESTVSTDTKHVSSVESDDDDPPTILGAWWARVKNRETRKKTLLTTVGILAAGAAAVYGSRWQARREGYRAGLSEGSETTRVLGDGSEDE